MKIFKFLDRIEYEALIPSQFNRWNSDAVLFRVNNGLGKLSHCYGNDLNGELHSFLMLDNKPIIDSHGEENYCPTCAKVLNIGLGRENVDQALINSIKYLEEQNENLLDTFNSVKTMLSILGNGYYLLTYTELIPTDGEGNYFWNLSNNKRVYNSTADIYYKFHVADGTPKFILPSQNMSCFNKDRVNFYINQVREGKSMTGLAYYYEGFMCTLLDGHHRATAAYMENKTVNCLTIIKVSGLGFDSERNPDKIYAGGQSYELSMFKNPKRIYEYIQKLFEKKQAQLSKEQVQNIINVYKDKQSDCKDINLGVGKKQYPDYMSIGFASMAEDVSEEHIKKVMSKYDEDSIFELEILLRRLILEDPKRAFELANRIARNANWKDLWEDVYEYLSTIDSNEVEDIFIKYLIDNDYDSKDKCRKIADKYLNNRK